MSLPALMLVSMDVAVAQGDFIQRNRHAVAFSVGRIDHAYAGSAGAGMPFEYKGIGVGLSYAGPQVRAAGLFARPEGDRTLLDLSAMGWILPAFAKSQRAKTVIAMPIGFLVAWRRLTAGSDDVIPFRASAIMLGAGGSLMHNLNRRMELELRVMPLAGITTSQVADAAGFSWAADAEVCLGIARILSSLGLTVGYSFRYQLWNVNGSRVFSEAVDELYDHAGTVHTMSAGIWF